MNDTADDGLLIKQMMQKNPEALEKLYDRYEQVIYSFAYRIVKDSKAAEEVVQTVFLRIWKHAEQWDTTKGDLITWMFTLTRNISLDHLRNHSSEEPQQPEESEGLEAVADPAALTEEAVQLLMAGEQVRQALRGLSRDQQQVMDMIYYQGLSQQEVADLASIPPGTVKSRVRLAMKQLQKRLIYWGRREQLHE